MVRDYGTLIAPALLSGFLAVSACTKGEDAAASIPPGSRITIGFSHPENNVVTGTVSYQGRSSEIDKQRAQLGKALRTSAIKNCKAGLGPISSVEYQELSDKFVEKYRFECAGWKDTTVLPYKQSNTQVRYVGSVGTVSVIVYNFQGSKEDAVETAKKAHMAYAQTVCRTGVATADFSVLPTRHELQKAIEIELTFTCAPEKG